MLVRWGAPISRQTLCDWVGLATEAALSFGGLAHNLIVLFEGELGWLRKLQHHEVCAGHRYGIMFFQLGNDRSSVDE